MNILSIAHSIINLSNDGWIRDLNSNNQIRRDLLNFTLQNYITKLYEASAKLDIYQIKEIEAPLRSLQTSLLQLQSGDKMQLDAVRMAALALKNSISPQIPQEKYKIAVVEAQVDQEVEWATKILMLKSAIKDYASLIAFAKEIITSQNPDHTKMLITDLPQDLLQTAMKEAWDNKDLTDAYYLVQLYVDPKVRQEKIEFLCDQLLKQKQFTRAFTTIFLMNSFQSQIAWFKRLPDEEMQKNFREYIKINNYESPFILISHMYDRVEVAFEIAKNLIISPLIMQGQTAFAQQLIDNCTHQELKKRLATLLLPSMQAQSSIPMDRQEWEIHILTLKSAIKDYPTLLAFVKETWKITDPEIRAGLVADLPQGVLESAYKESRHKNEPGEAIMLLQLFSNPELRQKELEHLCEALIKERQYGHAIYAISVMDQGKRRTWYKKIPAVAQENQVKMLIDLNQYTEAVVIANSISEDKLWIFETLKKLIISPLVHHGRFQEAHALIPYCKDQEVQKGLAALIPVSPSSNYSEDAFYDNELSDDEAELENESLEKEIWNLKANIKDYASLLEFARAVGDLHNFRSYCLDISLTLLQQSFDSALRKNKTDALALAQIIPDATIRQAKLEQICDLLIQEKDFKFAIGVMCLMESQKDRLIWLKLLPKTFVDREVENFKRRATHYINFELILISSDNKQLVAIRARKMITDLMLNRQLATARNLVTSCPDEGLKKELATLLPEIGDEQAEDPWLAYWAYQELIHLEKNNLPHQYRSFDDLVVGAFCSWAKANCPKNRVPQLFIQPLSSQSDRGAQLLSEINKCIFEWEKEYTTVTHKNGRSVTHVNLSWLNAVEASSDEFVFILAQIKNVHVERTERIFTSFVKLNEFIDSRYRLICPWFRHWVRFTKQFIESSGAKQNPLRAAAFSAFYHWADAGFNREQIPEIFLVSQNTLNFPELIGKPFPQFEQFLQRLNVRIWKEWIKNHGKELDARLDQLFYEIYLQFGTDRIKYKELAEQLLKTAQQEKATEKKEEAKAEEVEGLTIEQLIDLKLFEEAVLQATLIADETERTLALQKIEAASALA